MPRVLVLYYSQSGDVAAAAEAFSRPLRDAGATVVTEEIRATVAYPFPWRTFGRLFDVFPECILGLAPKIESPSFAADDRFDLVILAYQVWFLSPSLPVQGFFRDASAGVLKNTKVITLCVNRNMWHNASETVKKLLGRQEAIHLDNVVVSYAGPPWATFVSAIRCLLFGKRDGLGRLIPPAGVGPAELERLGRLGGVVAESLDRLDDPAVGPLLRGRGAVRVIRRYIGPEMVAWRVYRHWARLAVWAGRLGRPARSVVIHLFMLWVVAAVVVGLPFAMLLAPLLYPLVRGRNAHDAERLAEPSGELFVEEEASGRDTAEHAAGV